ncbi:hypothetical protein NL489_26775, partial [Klebsiella pneumoniae]|nr:hypothetical protein [Klebsiella pneumoniae]
DPEMLGQIEGKIKDDKVNAEEALKEVTDTFISMFEAMTDNAYMQERAVVEITASSPGTSKN